MSNHTTPTLRGTKIYLEPLSATDAEDIFRENVGDVPASFFRFETKQDVEQWIQETLKEIHAGEKIEFVIRTHAGAFAGMIAVNTLTTAPEFGLWIATGKRKLGLGKDAMITLRDWLFATRNIDSIRYITEPENVASFRLAQGLHFAPESRFVEDGITYTVFLARRPEKDADAT